jgi:hypothetical protein
LNPTVLVEVNKIRQMKIVINNLTRMKGQHICVAGIDLDSGMHVRPLINPSRFNREHLKIHGGPFDVSVVVQIENAKPIGRPPEMEDYLVDPKNIKFSHYMEGETFWEVLNEACHDDLQDIFGEDLERARRGYAINLGSGSVSLGCLLPRKQPVLEIDGWGKIRLNLSNGQDEVNLSVTDLRLYKEDNATPETKIVSDVARRLSRGTRVILSVGLSRSFRAQNDTEERHWLQVNGIHLEDEPTWTIEG